MALRLFQAEAEFAVPAFREAELKRLEAEAAEAAPFPSFPLGAS
jgi:hypothetical protein